MRYALFPFFLIFSLAMHVTKPCSKLSFQRNFHLHIFPFCDNLFATAYRYEKGNCSSSYKYWKNEAYSALRLVFFADQFLAQSHSHTMCTFQPWTPARWCERVLWPSFLHRKFFSHSFRSTFELRVLSFGANNVHSISAVVPWNQSQHRMFLCFAPRNDFFFSSLLVVSSPRELFLSWLGHTCPKFSAACDEIPSHEYLPFLCIQGHNSRRSSTNENTPEEFRSNGMFV